MLSKNRISINKALSHSFLKKEELYSLKTLIIVRLKIITI